MANYTDTRKLYIGNIKVKATLEVYSCQDDELKIIRLDISLNDKKCSIEFTELVNKRDTYRRFYTSKYRDDNNGYYPYLFIDDLKYLNKMRNIDCVSNYRKIIKFIPIDAEISEKEMFKIFEDNTITNMKILIEKIINLYNDKKYFEIINAKFEYIISCQCFTLPDEIAYIIHELYIYKISPELSDITRIHYYNYYRNSNKLRIKIARPYSLQIGPWDTHHYLIKNICNSKDMKSIIIQHKKFNILIEKSEFQKY